MHFGHGLKAAIVGGIVLAGAQGALGQDVTLTIESWRTDDLVIWQDQIIPAFEAAHPGIKVEFQATAPTEFSAALEARLAGGTAGDLITCLPFDASLDRFDRGYLAPLNDLAGMANFSPVAKAAWSTDDQGTTFCVPMGSVIHGFIYNKDAFETLGLEVPTTQAEFFEVLDAIKADGTYIPLAIGAADLWVAGALGYMNIGPAAWKGEEGRTALVAGEQKVTDEEWVAPFRELAKWTPYLAPGFEAQSVTDSQTLFTLGRAAIYPAGSWEIAGFNTNAEFEIGAFPPPVPAEGDQCYITDHPDMALGMNAATEHPEEAKIFLEWVSTADFATIFANALPGFFSLNTAPVAMEDPVAQEFVSWREDCESTIRATYAILSRGNPNFDNETSEVSTQVLKGLMTPEEASQRLQDGLDSWYTPSAN